jgi:hypothetical protein
MSLHCSVEDMPTLLCHSPDRNALTEQSDIFSSG